MTSMKDGTPIPLKPLISSANKGILRLFPPSWAPYAELARVHKPIGIFNIYFPYLFGCLFAALADSSRTSPYQLMTACFHMAVTAFVLRSVGCAWNDLVDRDLDAETERCRSRPIARGAIPLLNAYIYCLSLVALWTYLLHKTATPQAFAHAMPIPVFAAFYPYAKRITDFPQAVLGVTLSLGVFVGSAQLDLTLDNVRSAPEQDYNIALGLASLFLVYFIWSLIHDTVYGFQDIKDDIRLGIKSMAVISANHATACLVVLSVAQIASLIGVGYCLALGPGYHLISCGGVTAMLTAMIYQLDVSSVDKCRWWFEFGSMSFGMLVTAGLVWEYVSAL